MMSNQHQAQAQMIQTSDGQLFIYQPVNNTLIRPLSIMEMPQLPSLAIGNYQNAPQTSTVIREVPQNQQIMMVPNGDHYSHPSQPIHITGTINGLSRHLPSPVIENFQNAPQNGSAIRVEGLQNQQTTVMMVPNGEHYCHPSQPIPITAAINGLRMQLPSSVIENFQIDPQTTSVIREVPRNQQTMVMMVPNGGHYSHPSQPIPTSAAINGLSMQLPSPVIENFQNAPQNDPAIRVGLQNQQTTVMMVPNGEHYSYPSQSIPITAAINGLSMQLSRPVIENYQIAPQTATVIREVPRNQQTMVMMVPNGEHYSYPSQSIPINAAINGLSMQLSSPVIENYQIAPQTATVIREVPRNEQTMVMMLPNGEYLNNQAQLIPITAGINRLRSMQLPSPVIENFQIAPPTSTVIREVPQNQQTMVMMLPNGEYLNNQAQLIPITAGINRLRSMQLPSPVIENFQIAPPTSTVIREVPQNQQPMVMIVPNGEHYCNQFQQLPVEKNGSRIMQLPSPAIENTQIAPPTSTVIREVPQNQQPMIVPNGDHHCYQFQQIPVENNGSRIMQLPSPAIDYSQMAPHTPTAIKVEVLENQQDMMLPNGEHLNNQAQLIPKTAGLNRLRSMQLPSPVIENFQIAPATSTVIREVPQNQQPMIMIEPNGEHYCNPFQQLPVEKNGSRIMQLPSPAIDNSQMAPQSPTAIKEEVLENQQDMVMMLPNGEHLNNEAQLIPITAGINRLRSMQLPSPVIENFQIAPQTSTVIREVPQNQQTMAMIVPNGEHYYNQFQQLPVEKNGSRIMQLHSPAIENFQIAPHTSTVIREVPQNQQDMAMILPNGENHCNQFQQIPGEKNGSRIMQLPSPAIDYSQMALQTATAFKEEVLENQQDMAMMVSNGEHHCYQFQQILVENNGSRIMQLPSPAIDYSQMALQTATAIKEEVLENQQDMAMMVSDGENHCNQFQQIPVENNGPRIMQLPSPAIDYSQMALQTTTAIKEEVLENQQDMVMMVSDGENHCNQFQQIPVEKNGSRIMQLPSPAIENTQMALQTATAIKEEVLENQQDMIVPNGDLHCYQFQQIPVENNGSRIMQLPSPAIDYSQMALQTPTAIKEEVLENQQDMVMMVSNGEQLGNQSQQIPVEKNGSRIMQLSSPAIDYFQMAPQTATAIREVVPQTPEETMACVNPKQYNRVFVRRQDRLKLITEGRLSITRDRYLYESHHNHAMKRLRGVSGHFESGSLKNRDMSSSENMQNYGNSITTCTITNLQKMSEE